MHLDSHLSAYICGHIVRHEKPVLYVDRDEGDWQLLCGGLHDEGEIPHVVGIGHLFDTDPTFLSIIDLVEGQEAERTEGGSVDNLLIDHNVYSEAV